MKRVLTLAALVVLSACAEQVRLIPESAFNAELDGKPISIYTLNGGGLTAQVTNYGARVVSLWAPDRRGRMADVVIGYGDIEDYINNPGERFLGSSPGPVANRIAGASFELDGNTYSLSANDGRNTLHGGFNGIDRLVWDVVELCDSTILMEVVHPDGADGFPGNKTITVRYTLSSYPALKVEFSATTDAPTPVNLAHHPFFNLKGSGRGNILDHLMTINAQVTTPVDEELIPTGETALVEGTPFDFREYHAIGERIDADNEQLRFGHGYDHNWVIDFLPGASGLCEDASVYEPSSGRFLVVFSDQPGLQFYSGNFFGDGKTVDKYGHPIVFRGAFALETQKFPDAVHHPGFPDTILRPGETYTHTCLSCFLAN